MAEPTSEPTSEHASGTTEEQIDKVIPFLKHTNPHMSNEELRELAKKMLTVKLSPDDTDLDKPVSEASGQQ